MPLLIRAENIPNAPPFTHNMPNIEPAAKEAGKIFNFSSGSGDWQQGRRGRQGGREWCRRDSCKIGKSVQVQRRKLILTK